MVAEVFAELLYSRIPLSELAGLDDVQLVWLYARPRDEMGRLIKPGRPQAASSPQGNAQEDRDGPLVTAPVPLEEAYKQVKRLQSSRAKGKVIQGKVFEGLSEADIDNLWAGYLEANPKLKQQAEKREARKRKKLSKKPL